MTAPRHDANATRVNEIMTPNPISCRPENDGANAMEAMSYNSDLVLATHRYKYGHNLSFTQLASARPDDCPVADLNRLHL